MGNALKAVATGGMSLLPGKFGKVAGSVATGLPLVGGNPRKRGLPTKPIGEPGGFAGPGKGGMPIEKVMPANPGIISRLVGAQAPAAMGRGGYEQVAQNIGRAMGRIPQQPNGQVAQRVNPAEVATRGRFGY